MALPPAIAGAEAIAALTSGRTWNGAVVTYSVARAGSIWWDYRGGGEPASVGYGVLSDTQAQRFRDAMAVWDGLTALSFAETDDVTATGRIRVAATATGFWGFAYYPGPGKGGDIWISSSVTDATDFAAGTYDWQALLHEIGHAIGLKHPFEGAATLPVAYDNHRYSIMSYTGLDELVLTFSGDGDTLSWTASRPMLATPGLFDILAIQAMYGVDTTTRAGATTYRFDPFDSTIQVIADPGGIDTFDLSSATRPSRIDLREEAFSSVNLYGASSRIEDEVARYGETFRDTITTLLISPEIYIGRDNVGIAYGTVIENVRLGHANDSVLGNDAPNGLWGGDGNDSLTGGAGADTLRGGSGDDRMAGGAGNDLYIVDSSDDLVIEEAGGGTDTVISACPIHALEAGVEVLRTTAAAPATLLGNALANTIFGGTHADLVMGGAGDDFLRGLADADRLFGSAGDDLLLGGAGADTLFGGPGQDRLWGQAGDDQLVGDAGEDILFGGDGQDVLFGRDGADALLGEAGADILLGGADGDTLSGGTGCDTLIGGAGADVLLGGPDADAFRFLAPSEAGDVIRDFHHAQGDVILLAGPFRGATFIALADPEAPSEEAALLYDTTTGTLRYDPDGCGPAAALLLATLAGAPALSAADIVYG